MPIIKTFDIVKFVVDQQGTFDNGAGTIVQEIIRAQPVLGYLLYVALPIVTMVLSCFYCCGLRCCAVGCTAEQKAQKLAKRIKERTRKLESQKSDQGQMTSMQEKLAIDEAKYEMYKTASDKTMCCHTVCYMLFLIYGIIAIVGIALVFSGAVQLVKTDHFNKAMSLPKLFIDNGRALVADTDKLINVFKLKNGTENAQNILTKAIYQPESQIGSVKSVVQTIFPDGIQLISKDIPESVNRLTTEIIGSVSNVITAPDITQKQQDLLDQKLADKIKRPAQELYELLLTQQDPSIQMVLPLFSYFFGENKGDLPQFLMDIGAGLVDISVDISQMVQDLGAYLQNRPLTFENVLLGLQFDQTLVDQIIAIFDSIKAGDASQFLDNIIPQEAITNLQKTLTDLQDICSDNNKEFTKVFGIISNVLTLLQKMDQVTFKQLLSFVDDTNHPVPPAIELLRSVNSEQYDIILKDITDYIDDFKAKISGQNDVVSKFNAMTSKYGIGYLLNTIALFFIVCIGFASLALFSTCTAVVRRRSSAVRHSVCCIPCNQFAFVLCSVCCTLPCIMFAVILSIFAAAENIGAQYDQIVQIPSAKDKIDNILSKMNFQPILSDINSGMSKKIGLSLTSPPVLDSSSAQKLLDSFAVQMTLDVGSSDIGKELVSITDNLDKMLCQYYWRPLEAGFSGDDFSTTPQTFCNGIISEGYESPIPHCPEDYAELQMPEQCLELNQKHQLEGIYYQMRMIMEQQAGNLKSIVEVLLFQSTGKPTDQEIFDAIRQFINDQPYQFLRDLSALHVESEISLNPVLFEILKHPVNFFNLVLIDGKTMGEKFGAQFEKLFADLASFDGKAADVFAKIFDRAFQFYDFENGKPLGLLASVLNTINQFIGDLLANIPLPELFPQNNGSEKLIVISKLINEATGSSSFVFPSVDKNLQNIQHVLLSFEDELRAFTDDTVFGCNPSIEGSNIKMTCKDSHTAGGTFELHKDDWNSTDANVTRDFYYTDFNSLLDAYITMDGSTFKFKSNVVWAEVARARFSLDPLNCGYLTPTECNQLKGNIIQQYETMMKQVLEAFSGLNLKLQKPSDIYGLLRAFYGFYADLDADEIAGSQYLASRIRKLLDDVSAYSVYLEYYINKLLQVGVSLGSGIAASRVFNDIISPVLHALAGIFWGQLTRPGSLSEAYYTVYRGFRYPFGFLYQSFNAVFAGLWLMYTCAVIMPILAACAYPFVLRSSEWSFDKEGGCGGCCGCCCGGGKKGEKGAKGGKQNVQALQAAQAAFAVQDGGDDFYGVIGAAGVAGGNENGAGGGGNVAGAADAAGGANRVIGVIGVHRTLKDILSSGSDYVEFQQGNNAIVAISAPDDQ